MEEKISQKYNEKFNLIQYPNYSTIKQKLFAQSLSPIFDNDVEKQYQIELEHYQQQINQIYEEFFQELFLQYNFDSKTNELLKKHSQSRTKFKDMEKIFHHLAKFTLELQTK